MKYYIAKFAVPDDFKPKTFKNSKNVDGWFTNKKGLMVSIPASLQVDKTATKEDKAKVIEAEWNYLFTEDPEVFKCSYCGGFSGVDEPICSRCGAIMKNGK